jgi:magnesium transporter
LPEKGFIWLTVSRERLDELQATLQRLCGQQRVDLHVSDLLNVQLPSHQDYTSQYDLLVFQRLTTSRSPSDAGPKQPARKLRGPVILRRIETHPVGLVIFDRVLLSVHADGDAVRDSYADRLLEAGSQTGRSAGAKLPTGPADLMLRLVNLMVDQYLDLRRELNRQIDHWQAELLNPGNRFSNWSAVLDARITLHRLDEVCEDQRSAIHANSGLWWVVGLMAGLTCLVLGVFWRKRYLASR